MNESGAGLKYPNLLLSLSHDACYIHLVCIQGSPVGEEYYNYKSVILFPRALLAALTRE